MMKFSGIMSHKQAHLSQENVKLSNISTLKIILVHSMIMLRNSNMLDDIFKE